MARIRTIKPDFWGSPKTAKVSRDARLLFLGLLNEADDEGRLLGSARSIGGSLFPNDDDFCDDDIRACLNTLEGAGFIRRYVVEGVAYVLIIGFKEHQKLSHPTKSRLPEPPDHDSGAAPEKFRKDSGEPPEKFAPDLGSGTGNREQGTGNRESTSDSNGSESLALVPYPSPPAASCSFDDFWPSYPKRNGKRVGKPKTLERWKRLSPVDRQAALIGARFYAMACDRGLTIAKDPERWVRDRCWDDWQEPAEVSTPKARPKSMDLLERRMAMHRAAEA